MPDYSRVRMLRQEREAEQLREQYEDDDDSTSTSSPSDSTSSTGATTSPGASRQRQMRLEREAERLESGEDRTPEIETGETSSGGDTVEPTTSPGASRQRQMRQEREAERIERGEYDTPTRTTVAELHQSQTGPTTAPSAMRYSRGVPEADEDAFNVSAFDPTTREGVTPIDLPDEQESDLRDRAASELGIDESEVRFAEQDGDVIVYRDPQAAQREASTRVASSLGLAPTQVIADDDGDLAITSSGARRLERSARESLAASSDLEAEDITASLTSEGRLETDVREGAVEEQLLDQIREENPDLEIGREDVEFTREDGQVSVEITGDVEPERETRVGRAFQRGSEIWRSTGEDIAERAGNLGSGSDDPFQLQFYIAGGQPVTAEIPISRGDVTETVIKSGAEATDLPGLALSLGDLGGAAAREIQGSRQARARARREFVTRTPEEQLNEPGETAALAAEAIASPQHTRSRVRAGGSVAQEAGEDYVAHVQENPLEETFRVTGGVLGGLAIGGAVSRGGRAAGSLARRGRSLDIDYQPRDFVSDNRGQLDLAGRSRRRGGDVAEEVDISPRRTTPDADPRVFERARGRQPGQVDPGEVVPEIGSRPPRSGLERRRDFAESVRRRRREQAVEEATTPTPPTGRAAGTASAAQVPGGDVLTGAAVGGLLNESPETDLTRGPNLVESIELGEAASQRLATAELEGTASGRGSAARSGTDAGALGRLDQAQSPTAGGDTPVDLTGPPRERAASRGREGLFSGTTTRGATRVAERTAFRQNLTQTSLTTSVGRPLRPARPPRRTPIRRPGRLSWPDLDLGGDDDDEDGVGFGEAVEGVEYRFRDPLTGEFPTAGEGPDALPALPGLEE